MYAKNFFRPKNPNKYKGDPSDIVFRSSYELKYMMELDKNENVISWGSEVIIIPYKSPKDQRIHRYFVDFIVTEMVNGKQETKLIEVKPYRQTLQPKKPDRVTKRFLTELTTWGINNAKWKAADEFCKDRGWKFLIYTEKELNIPMWKK